MKQRVHDVGCHNTSQLYPSTSDTARSATASTSPLSGLGNASSYYAGFAGAGAGSEAAGLLERELLPVHPAEGGMRRDLGRASSRPQPSASIVSK